MPLPRFTRATHAADNGTTRARRVGKRGILRHSVGERTDLASEGDCRYGGDVKMRMLRFIAVALVAASSGVPLGAAVFAAPLDKGACLKLQADRQKLLTPKMQAALEQGP